MGADLKRVKCEICFLRLVMIRNSVDLNNMIYPRGMGVFFHVNATWVTQSTLLPPWSNVFYSTFSRMF